MDDLYANEEKIKRRAEKAALARLAQDDIVLQNLMASDLGRRWTHDLIASCGIWTSTFTGDALSGAFNEGRRSVGLFIFAGVMRACPDAYIQMMREANAGRPDDTDDTDE